MLYFKIPVIALGLFSWSLLADQPDFLIFTDDDLSQFDITPYGAEDVRTPNFQKLADEGMRFNRAFTASPACAPSRAAMLTGLMPARNGAMANHTYKRENIPSLPPLLHALGYEIAAFGKVAHGKDSDRHGFDYINAKYDRETIETWLKQRDSSKPLCLFFGSRSPHVPWPANDGYDPDKLRLPPNHIDTPQTREFRARYYTDIEISDTEYGYVRELAAKYLNKNLLTIMSSDHGSQWPFAKWNLYDAGIQVPFLVSWPGHIKAGTQTDAMVSWIDILPTLIDIAGGKTDPGIDGRSFAKVLSNPEASHRDRIFTIHDNDGRANVYPIRSVRTDRWKYIRNLQPTWIHSTHSYRFRKDDAGAYWWSWDRAAEKDPVAGAIVAKYHTRPEEELYDLDSDPWELNNLAALPQMADKLLQLRAELDDWLVSQTDPMKVTVEPWRFGDAEFLEPATKGEDW
ncbi:MAG: sulfatase [Verrucomicrobia bacterium]|nr:sulfatase [Verrucomicrobiota bacterium]MDA1066893.1 sulfatase [Verrucomicrobiota bacterium]